MYVGTARKKYSLTCQCYVFKVSRGQSMNGCSKSDLIRIRQAPIA